MTIFSASSAYVLERDVLRKSTWCDDWASRLRSGEQPNGIAWAIVAPRRGGKTWALASIASALPPDDTLYIDVQMEGLDALEAQQRRYLLVDELGSAAPTPESWRRVVTRIRAIARGSRVVIAMTPHEHSALSAALGDDRRLAKDTSYLPKLNPAMASALAFRALWAPSLLETVPAAWRSRPALLERFFEVAEARPDLRAAPEALARAVLERACHQRIAEETFERSCSPEQRRTLVAVARQPHESRAGDLAVLEGAGLVTLGPDGRYTIDHPVLAHHLPPPLILHHVSDLHFGPKTLEAADVKARQSAHGQALGGASAPKAVRDTYLTHLASEPAHVLIVSGDLTETGTDEQYRDAVAWLAHVRGALATHPDVAADASRVLLVPGNHDVDWMHVDGVDGERQRHQRFAQFFGQYPRPLLERAASDRPLAVVPFAGAGVEIVLLGSAELGGQTIEDPDYHALAQLVERLMKDATAQADDHERYRKLSGRAARIDPGLVHHEDIHRITAHRWTQPVRIAVLHHPVSPLPAAPEIAPYATLLNAGALKAALFKAGVQLVLHGHQHRAWCGHERWPADYGDAELCIAAAATLGSHETSDGLGFNEIRVQRIGEAREVTIQAYRHNGAGQWLAERAPIAVAV